MGSLVRRCAFVVVGAVMCATLWGIAPLPASAANLVVTNCNSSGIGSLSAGIAFAIAGDTVSFTPGLNCSSTGAGPIVVASTLTIGQSLLTIDGAGATIVVDGGCTGCDPGPGFSPNGGVRVFDVNGGGTVTFSNLTIQHGHTTGLGGAISVTSAATVTVRDSALTANVAGNGGAISLASAAVAVTVRNSVFSGNATTSVGGGAIISFGPLTVTGSTFAGNTAPINGGSINVQPGGTANVSNSTFANNTSGSLGGATSNLGTIILTNVTMSGNKGSAGAGLATGYANPILTNTIIANSIGGALSPATPSTPTPTYNGTNNLIDDAATAGDFTDGTNGNIVGHPALLGTLGNNGGTTQTIPLLPGSPALDAGAAVGAGPATNPVPATDQRGITRPQGNGVDIGAFEGRFTLTVTGGNPQSALVSQPFTTPLTVTLSSPDGLTPLGGAPITFTAPASGASATLGTPNPATTNASGQASITATANGTGGTYSVTASAPGAATATFSLTNIAPLVSIVVTPANATLKVGQTQQFTATGTFADNSTANITTQVTWTSDAPNVAGVDATTGNATAKSAGSAHITATQGAVSGQTTVTVGTPVLTGAQPAPAPPGRQGGTASQPGSGSSPASPAPVPAPSGR